MPLEKATTITVENMQHTQQDGTCVPSCLLVRNPIDATRIFVKQNKENFYIPKFI